MCLCEMHWYSTKYNTRVYTSLVSQAVIVKKILSAAQEDEKFYHNFFSRIFPTMNFSQTYSKLNKVVTFMHGALTLL